MAIFLFEPQRQVPYIFGTVFQVTFLIGEPVDTNANKMGGFFWLNSRCIINHQRHTIAFSTIYIDDGCFDPVFSRRKFYDEDSINNIGFLLAYTYTPLPINRHFVYPYIVTVKLERRI